MSVNKTLIVIAGVAALAALAFLGMRQDRTTPPEPVPQTEAVSSEAAPAQQTDAPDQTSQPAAAQDVSQDPPDTGDWICTRQDAQANCLQWTVNPVGSVRQ